ncbi:MAG: ribonuclease D [Candidatus Pelagibacterales bacterium]
MQTHLYKNDLDDGIVFKGNVAIDTEAMGLDPARDRLCLIQIFDGETDCHMVQFENSNTESPNLIKLLNDENIQKIFHYARFDMAALRHALKIDVKNVYCTKIASKIARTYTNNHGLKDLCKELLGVEISKKQQSSDWGNSNLSKEQISYATNDVIYLHQIKNKLDEMLVREDRQLLVDACLSFLPTRVELDLRGWENDIFSHSS